MSRSISGTLRRLRQRASGARAERVALVCIVAVGILAALLLAWDHLGLGAWLFPPAPSPAQQITVAGPYSLRFEADSGQLTTGGPNTVSFAVRDAAGQPIADAALALRPEMTAMAMTAPAVAVSAAEPRQAGRFVAHPRFSMAGIWRLDVTIARPGQAPEQASFTVSVRWS